MPRPQLLLGVLLLAGIASSRSQDAQPDPSAKREPAVISIVQVVQEGGLPAVEIVSSHPVLPAIKVLDSPPRLVIDLSNALLGLQRKRTPVLQQDILTLHTEQFQKDPPITRIVLDLLVPYGYTWDVAGDRLMVRLKPIPNPAMARKPPSQLPQTQAMSLSASAAPVAVPVTSGIGEVVLAGSRSAVGSSLTAGSETTELRLARGGEVRVCPGTTVSITPSKSAKDLMLGLSNGAMETHYSLEASADTVLTPDFRILFVGPGEFDYAISSDAHGNTCVRGLKGNTSSAIVSELIGDRTYQVNPTEQAVFRAGRIDKVDTDVPLECGCPPPVPVLRTETEPTHVAPASDSSQKITLASGNSPPESSANSVDSKKALSNGSETRPLPAAQTNDVHVQVDAPLVFHASTRTSAPPAPTAETAALPVMQSSPPVWLQTQVQPPPVSEPSPEHHRLMRKIRRFFAGIFS